MATGTLQVEICAPGHLAVSLDAAEVAVPGEEGVFTVLPGHTPLLSTLVAGVVVVTCADGQERFFAINEGVAEVLKDKVVVLTDTYEEGDQIDNKRAEAARERAEARLRAPEEHTNLARAEAALRRAMARIQAQSRIKY